MGERRGVPSQPGADELLTAPGSRVPHHGPVTRDCPVECLLTVLSFRSFNPLARAYDAPFAEPRTVADVMDLYTRRQLRKIRGIGPRRVSEIEAALVLAGLNLAGHQERPRAGRTATRPGAPSAAHPPEDPCPQEPQP
jgi:hypothetical protein